MLQSIINKHTSHFSRYLKNLSSYNQYATTKTYTCQIFSHLTIITSIVVFDNIINTVSHLIVNKKENRYGQPNLKFQCFS